MILRTTSSLTISIPSPDGTITLLTVKPDGKIEKGPAFTTNDEASLLFWEAVENTVKKMRGKNYTLEEAAHLLKWAAEIFDEHKISADNWRGCYNMWCNYDYDPLESPSKMPE